MATPVHNKQTNAMKNFFYAFDLQNMYYAYENKIPKHTDMKKLRQVRLLNEILVSKPFCFIICYP